MLEAAYAMGIMRLANLIQNAESELKGQKQYVNSSCETLKIALHLKGEPSTVIAAAKILKEDVETSS